LVREKNEKNNRELKGQTNRMKIPFFTTSAVKAGMKTPASAAASATAGAAYGAALVVAMYVVPAVIETAGKGGKAAISLFPSGKPVKGEAKTQKA